MQQYQQGGGPGGRSPHGIFYIISATSFEVSQPQFEHNSKDSQESSVLTVVTKLDCTNSYFVCTPLDQKAYCYPVGTEKFAYLNYSRNPTTPEGRVRCK